MALHRDIYWVGKQWAVTGYGIQACNQRQRGQFDIAGARLWEDGVQGAVRAEKWVNADDFEKAVSIARKYYPEPPGWTPPPKPAAPAELEPVPPQQAPAKLTAPKFDMHHEGLRATLTPVWRIRSAAAAQSDNR
jgi:hypothetical protein